MSNEEILKTAMEKAERNGWGTVLPEMHMSFARSFGEATLLNMYIRGLIFSHDFAKAFWGEVRVDGNTGVVLRETYQKMGVGYANWQYHLQQMVLEDDPIKYLEQFLEVRKG